MDATKEPCIVCVAPTEGPTTQMRDGLCHVSCIQEAKPASKFAQTETIEPCVGCGQPGGRWGVECVIDGSNGRKRGKVWHHGCQNEAILASCAPPTIDCSGDPL